MSTAGAVRDYSSTQKEHWRRWAWNEVLSRTNGREQNEVVLYLLGPDDNDRRVALEKGVPNESLIGVDLNRDNVRACRQRGGLAIQGVLHDMLIAWPSQVAVCAVMADFCSGIEYSNIATPGFFESKFLSHAVLLLNVMRGRDPFGNSVREMLQTCELAAAAKLRIAGFEEKSRAYQLLAYSLIETYVMQTRGLRGPTPKGGVNVYLDQREFEPIRRFVLWAMEAWSPVFQKYRSGPLVFDSVVCEPGVQSVCDRYGWVAEKGHLEKMATVFARAEEGRQRSLFVGKEGRAEVRQRISATLAHRTRRVRAA